MAKKRGQPKKIEGILKDGFGSIEKAYVVILQLASTGLDKRSIRAKLDSEYGVYIAKSTYYDLETRVKDGTANSFEKSFSELITRACDRNYLWWFEFGKENILSSKESSLIAPIYNKLMCSMFPEEFKDKEKSIEVSTGEVDVVIKIDGESQI